MGAVRLCVGDLRLKHGIPNIQGTKYSRNSFSIEHLIHGTLIHGTAYPRNSVHKEKLIPGTAYPRNEPELVNEPKLDNEPELVNDPELSDGACQ